MRRILAAAIVFSSLCLSSPVSSGADTVFSGPQPGENTTSFKVAPISGTTEAPERDPVSEAKGAPTALVFLHALERSLVPLLRVIDEYGAGRKEHLRTEVVFLAGDRVAGEQRMKAAANSLRLKSKVGVSVDGEEGPGNYGLNKECMMTVVIARDNKVTTNFALVQPGIADAPKVLAALAKVSGDASPPTVEQLTQRNPQRGMRESRDARQMRRADGTTAKDSFPGAVPTDEKLVSLLRQFIRPSNDDSTVDRVLNEVRVHIKDHPELRKQAIDGWTRILHFGDRYGTAHAREAGAAFLEELKKQ